MRGGLRNIVARAARTARTARTASVGESSRGACTLALERSAGGGDGGKTAFVHDLGDVGGDGLARNGSLVVVLVALHEPMVLGGELVSGAVLGVEAPHLNRDETGERVRGVEDLLPPSLHKHGEVANRVVLLLGVVRRRIRRAVDRGRELPEHLKKN